VVCKETKAARDLTIGRHPTRGAVPWPTSVRLKTLFDVGGRLAAGQPRTGGHAGRPTPQIRFSLGGQGKPETFENWNMLFYQPDAPWPEFMDHVKAVGILTQALVQISDDN
jgi:hypothetical protein